MSPLAQSSYWPAEWGAVRRRTGKRRTADGAARHPYLEWFPTARCGPCKEQAFHSECKIPNAEFEMARPQAVARRNGGRLQRLAHR